MVKKEPMTDKDHTIEIASEDDVRKYADRTAEEGGQSPSHAAPAPETGEPASKDPVDVLRRERDELKDKLLRAQAECANVSKRLTQQHGESLKIAGMALARSILAVVDSFERSIDGLEKSGTDKSVLEGVKLMDAQLLKALAEHGVTPIKAVGAAFDPSCHEALMTDRDTDAAPGTVTQEFQRGYTMHGRVVRPARVAVAGAEEGGGPSADGQDDSSSE
jgi:molecular chaperone GrpE